MNLISQIKAAEIAGVSKQAINKIKKAGSHNFFVGKKVDTDHPHWQSYMHERSCSGTKKQSKEDTKIENGIESVNEKQKEKEINPDMENYSQKNKLTGGYSPDKFMPENIQDIKRLAEIEKLRLEMEVRLGNLIDRDFMVNVIETISQSVASHFVDLPRRVSTRICQKLEKVGLEKEVETIIAESVQKGIQGVKKECKDCLKVKHDS
jgi:hypothetical protein